MGSIVREKAWITKTSSSLHKDGEHNVIVCEKYLETGYVSKKHQLINYTRGIHENSISFSFNRSLYSYIHID
jgi:hypothetical protein